MQEMSGAMSGHSNRLRRRPGATATDTSATNDVFQSLRRLRDEAARLVETVRIDALFANRDGVVAVEDARKRLEDVRQHAETVLALIRDLRPRRDAIVADLVSGTLEALGLATSGQITHLEMRMDELAGRVETLSVKSEQVA